MYMYTTRLPCNTEPRTVYPKRQSRNSASASSPDRVDPEVAAELVAKVKPGLYPAFPSSPIFSRASPSQDKTSSTLLLGCNEALTPRGRTLRVVNFVGRVVFYLNVLLVVLKGLRFAKISLIKITGIATALRLYFPFTDTDSSSKKKEKNL